MKEGVKPTLSLKQRVIAIALMVVGFVALVTPLTPGAWLGLIGLGMWLGKSPQETLVYVKGKCKGLFCKKAEESIPIV